MQNEKNSCKDAKDNTIYTDWVILDFHYTGSAEQLGAVKFPFKRVLKNCMRDFFQFRIDGF